MSPRSRGGTVTKRAMDLDGVPPPLPEPEQKDDVQVWSRPKTVKKRKGLIYGGPVMYGATVDLWPEEEPKFYDPINDRHFQCDRCGYWSRKDQMRRAQVLGNTLTPGLYQGAVCCVACRSILGESVALWDHL
jgi:hypothetical protein